MSFKKPSENARKYSFQPLASMYGLSPDIFLFQVFRDWWEQHEESQPILALQLARREIRFCVVQQK